MSPIVNVDIPMPKDLLNALSVHEAHCIGSRIETVTVESVTKFLTDRYGAKLAAKFKPEYLFNNQETSIAGHQ